MSQATCPLNIHNNTIHYLTCEECKKLRGEREEDSPSGEEIIAVIQEARQNLIDDGPPSGEYSKGVHDGMVAAFEGILETIGVPFKA